VNIIHVDYPVPAFAMTPRSLSQITDYIVHHEAGALSQTALDIDAEHRNEGWAMIGYNFVIDEHGNVYAARPLDVVPSAAYGRNTQSVNVSLAGNFQEGDPGYTGPPNAAQIQAIIDLGVYLHKMLPGIERTIGHRDVATMFYGGDGDYATACPGSMLYVELPKIKSAIAAAINK
jgi:hypothetical protein